MKWLYLALLLTIFTNKVRGQGRSLDNKINDVLKEKCVKNSNNKDAFTDLTNVTESLRDCCKDSVGELPKLSDNPSFASYCKDLMISKNYNCLKGMVDKLEVCLAKEEKYIPGFVLEMFNGTVKRVCHSVTNNTELTDFFKMVDEQPCIGQTMPMIPLFCLKDLKLIKNFQNNDYVIRKNDVCSDMEALAKCTNELILGDCKLDVSKYINSAFKLPLDWCKTNFFEVW